MERVQPAARRVTSTDVAREAGLSRTTVSYVLNDTPNQTIPDATRKRVLDAAARLGYAPSAAARILRSGRSDVVLCLYPDWPIGVVLGRLLEQISNELGHHGLTLLTYPGSGQARPLPHLLSAVTPAAILSFAPFSRDDRAVLEAAAIPVAIALQEGRGRYHVRSVDQRKVGRLQVEHLVEKGHRAIGYAFPDDPRVADFAKPRLAGVTEACADLGLRAPDVRTFGLDARDAELAVAHWLGRDTPITAVCAYNDEWAMAVLAGLRILGRRAPDDLAVVGVDDIPAAPLADPPLTTVRQDEVVAGRHIAACIVAALSGHSMPRHPGTAAITLQRRQST